MKLGYSVTVSLEGTIDDICSDIDHVWHNWLILATIPRNISWFSVSVSIGSSVVLMIDGGLSHSPLSVSVWERWVLWEDSCACIVEQVWVVNKCLCIEGIVVHDNWSVIEKTSTKTSYDEVCSPGIGEPASHVEILNGKLSDHEESQHASHLSSRGIVSPVEVRSINWSGNNIIHIFLLEPTSQLL